VIYRVAEPDVAVGRPAGMRAVTADALPFVYPDGSHNCETLLAHPRTGDLYLVTKRGGVAGVYRMPMPFTPGVRATLVHLRDIPIADGAVVTGGDIHPCASRVLLRTYGALYEYRAAAGAAFETTFGATAISVPVAREPQGEAVGYALDGRGYVTISEGASPTLNRVGCM
jgi:hypothetical protein